ncbi:MAG: head GIN domain-containing protein [Vitreoscilla sp.]
MRRLTANATHLVATLAITAAAVITACAMPLPAHALTINFSTGDGNTIAGSGKQVTVARPVGAFSVLRMDSSVDVHAHQGTTPSVTVHADDNIEPLVETVVEGDKLVVRLKKGSSFHTHHDVFVDVVFTSLTAAQQHGSGDLHIDKLSAPRFESSIAGSGDLRIENAQLGQFALSIAGSGDVVLSGSADEARFGVAGSGDINARNFTARKVSVSISGSGDAHVNATEALEAKVAGSGDITYSGHPRDVSRHVSGSGSVEAAN